MFITVNTVIATVVTIVAILTVSVITVNKLYRENARIRFESEEVINNYRTNLDNCVSMLNERNRTIEELESELQMHELVQEEYLKQIIQLRDTISELRKELTAKDAQIEELQTERDEYYTLWNNLLDEYCALEDKAAAKDAQIEELRAESNENFKCWMEEEKRSDEWFNKYQTYFDLWMEECDSNRKLRSQISELHSRISELHSRISELCSETDRLKMSLRSAHIKCEIAEGELAYHLQQNDKSPDKFVTDDELQIALAAFGLDNVDIDDEELPY